MVREKEESDCEDPTVSRSTGGGWFLVLTFCINSPCYITADLPC